MSILRFRWIPLLGRPCGSGGETDALNVALGVGGRGNDGRGGVISFSRTLGRQRNVADGHCVAPRQSSVSLGTLR